MVDVLDEAVQRRDALAQAGLHLAPFLARNDAGDEVKGDEALGAGAVFVLGAVDREGDAHAAEDHLGFFAPVSHQLGRLGLQPALVGTVVLADAGRCPGPRAGEGAHLVEGVLHGGRVLWLYWSEATIGPAAC